MNRFSSQLLVGLSLSGALSACVSLPGLGHSSAEIQVLPSVAGAGYAMQAVVAPYTAASINHLTLRLSKLANGGETPVVDGNGTQLSRDLSQAQLGSAPVAFSNLDPNTTYRVRAAAYKAPGTAAGDLISTSDSASFVDIPLTNDDRPPVVVLRVRLIDVLFSGQASASGVQVVNGGIVTASESIQ